jgi:predicted amidohydrolase
MNTLKVSLLQVSLVWENPLENRKKFTRIINAIPTDSDLIVLPEMFTTGFSMKPELLAEKMEGPSVNWMKETAKDQNAVITGSLIIAEKGSFFNRLIWMRPDGTYSWYDKRHLFSLAGEQNHYTAGKEKLITELKGFRMCPLICYDLRFPVWSRNKDEYDVAIYVANWPERRSFFWTQLLIARAIENQSFVIGVNRVGMDGNEIDHSGNSVALGPLGNNLCAIENGLEEVLQVTLDKAELKEVRNKFRFLEDRDEFEVTI